MSGHLYIVQGDVSQLSADVLVYSTNQYGKSGHLHESFRRHVPGFAAAYARGRKEAGQSDRHRLFVGDTFWLPLTHEDDEGGSRSPKGVVVVGVIGGGLSWEALNRKIVTAAIEEAARHLAPNLDGKHWLVAIPGLGMGAALDFHQESRAARSVRAEAARAQIEAAREALTARDDLDVAFVAYTPDIYHLYLNARREVPEAQISKAPPADDVPVPSELTQAIRDGECVLFIGSGLSASAGMPSWKKLIAKLAAELPPAPQKDTTDYYLDVAQLYRHRHGSERLAEVIRAEFGGTQVKPTLAHYLMMGMGVKRVITTNYDSLLERSLRASRRDTVTVVKEEDVARTGETGAYFVIKFHGDAEQSDDGIILSRSDYDGFFHDRPAMAALLGGLLLNQTFLFVGYSLSDPNFRQIYEQVARILKASKRRAYAVQLDADASRNTRDSWKSQQLELIDIPGTGEEQGCCFLRFLDGLASAVLDEPKLFVGARTGLRDALAALGREVSLAASRDDLNPEEVRQLSSTLTFLTRHGWRPSVQESAWGTWKRLADQSGSDLAQKRMMLREALKHTESLKDAGKVREELETVCAELKRLEDLAKEPASGTLP